MGVGDAERTVPDVRMAALKEARDAARRRHIAAKSLLTRARKDGAPRRSPLRRNGSGRPADLFSPEQPLVPRTARSRMSDLKNFQCVNNGHRRLRVD
jgi:hypothetical protein